MIIDTPFNTSAKSAALKAAGVGTVVRYYNFSNSSKLPEKRMELAEAQVLSANGFQIAVTFQQGQDKIADFSEAKGIAAGTRAFRYAHDNIGQAAGSGIYFSVDFDASGAEIASAIVPFFQGIAKAFVAESHGGPVYRVGVYGSGLVCGTLASKGLVELKWLAMSRGFQGTAAALAAGDFHLSQRAPAGTLVGLGVDFNDANPLKPDFGSFAIDPGADEAHAAAMGDRFRVIARSGLRLREGPGTQFDIVGMLNAGQVVFVSSVADGWAKVDVEGDGQIDGFASAGFLEKVS